MDTLKMCDDIYASAWFKKAARRAILICVDMHDDPLEAKKVRVEAKLSKVGPEERKERQKTRKEEEKKEVESFEKLLAGGLEKGERDESEEDWKPVSENSSNTTTTIIIKIATTTIARSRKVSRGEVRRQSVCASEQRSHGGSAEFYEPAFDECKE